MVLLTHVYSSALPMDVYDESEIPRVLKKRTKQSKVRHSHHSARSVAGGGGACDDGGDGGDDDEHGSYTAG